MADEFSYSIVIRCTKDALWQAITNPTQLSQHMFACDKVTGNPNLGGTLELLRKDGSVIGRQEIVEFTPPERVVAMVQPIIFGRPLPASRLAHTILVEGETCLLKVEQSGVETAAAELEEAAMRFCSSLKSWLETGSPIRVDA